MAKTQSRDVILEKAHATANWGNTHTSSADWQNTLEHGSSQERQRLFMTLFREDPDDSHIESLFSRDELSLWLETMNKKERRSWVERRRKVWRFLYCKIREPIPGLDWIVPAMGQKHG